MFPRLKECADRYREIEALLQDPEVLAQPARMQALMRELGGLRSRAESYEAWASLDDRKRAATEMLEDPDMRELAEEELTEVVAALDVMVDAMKREVADDDPHRGRDVMVEIRAGTGGDEATLFAQDLLKLYTRFAESHGLKLEILDSTATDVGGFKEVILSVAGPEAWDLLRYESGGHRVQRVPSTESQGRIHTSAATVAVLPEADEVELEIDEADLRIDTFRSSGPGGQSVNKTSSAIRVTHLPSGTTVQCQDEKSQHKNKSKALRMLRARLADAEASARKAEADSTRRSLIGSGDRSERIRTYNWPQNRVTDHRIKTSYSLEQVLLGQLDPVVNDLREQDLQEKLAALGEGAA